jgi:hypothetical protein
MDAKEDVPEVAEGLTCAEIWCEGPLSTRSRPSAQAPSVRFYPLVQKHNKLSVVSIAVAQMMPSVVIA